MKKETRWVVQVKGESHGHQVVETHALAMRLTEEQIRLMYEIFDSSDLVLSAICGRKTRDCTIGIAPWTIVLIGIEYDSTYYNYIYDWVLYMVENHQKPDRGYPIRADLERILESLAAHMETLDGLRFEYQIR